MEAVTRNRVAGELYQRGMRDILSPAEFGLRIIEVRSVSGDTFDFDIDNSTSA